jgi:hypothetical protein
LNELEDNSSVDVSNSSNNSSIEVSNSSNSSYDKYMGSIFDEKIYSEKNDNIDIFSSPNTRSNSIAISLFSPKISTPNLSPYLFNNFKSSPSILKRKRSPDNILSSSKKQKFLSPNDPLSEYFLINSPQKLSAKKLVFEENEFYENDVKTNENKIEENKNIVY